MASAADGTANGLELNLLSLPYDIRYQIYRDLFPPGEQIYVHVLGSTLRSITPGHRPPVELLRTCSTLHEEAGGYLYNSYLFNIVGSKKDCLAAYESFQSTVTRHAWNEVHVDAFSNGPHSGTMCISMQAGEGRMAVLKQRERGQPRSIDEMKAEVAMAASVSPNPQRLDLPLRSLVRSYGPVVVAVCIGLLAILLREIATTVRAA